MTHNRAAKALAKHRANGHDRDSLIKWWNRLVGWTEERNFGVVAFCTETVSGKVERTYVRFE